MVTGDTETTPKDAEKDKESKTSQGKQTAVKSSGRKPSSRAKPTTPSRPSGKKPKPGARSGGKGATPTRINDMKAQTNDTSRKNQGSTSSTVTSDDAEGNNEGPNPNPPKTTTQPGHPNHEEGVDDTPAGPKDDLCQEIDGTAAGTLGKLADQHTELFAAWFSSLKIDPSPSQKGL